MKTMRVKNQNWLVPESVSDETAIITITYWAEAYDSLTELSSRQSCTNAEKHQAKSKLLHADYLMDRLQIKCVTDNTPV